MSQALAPSQRDAVKLVTDAVATEAPRELPAVRQSEACDFDSSIENISPVRIAPARRCRTRPFHMRSTTPRLPPPSRVVLLDTEAVPTVLSIRASVHYEVEHSNPNHADVEACPICGRTGDYGGRPGNLVELVHDPLGLELLLAGTIRGERVRFEDYGQRDVESIGALGDKFSVNSLVFPGMSGDRNTLRIGTVVITAAMTLASMGEV